MLGIALIKVPAPPADLVQQEDSMDTFVPAAQYLRMSTEHQQYSLDNQADAIARYAAERGFKIVKTYSDAARSGLRLKNRDGLKQLLKEVMEGQKDFRAVLVYDVSRWGRFQDTDEAAHYEYLCKSAGVPIHYCAEMFANDNSVSGLILKALKRTMAGEYSRELSVKVKSGLLRLAKLGFKLGGSTPYGLRRQLLDASGEPKQVLAYGERKSLADEHVILIPGPANEVAVVNRIFREFADQHRVPNEIATRLNTDCIPFLRGATWKGNTIRTLLQNPNYIGMRVWGRTTAVLSTPVKRLPVQQWEISPNAFAPVVPYALFLRAQQTFANLTIRLTDEQLLERLGKTLMADGRLTNKVIARSRLCPGGTTYHKRFGSLLQAYARLGYETPERLGQLTSRLQGLLLRDSLVKKLMDAFPAQIEQVNRSKRFKPLLRYRRTGLLVSVLIARCYPTKIGLSWRIQAPKAERKRTAIVALLNENNSAVQSLRVFPNVPRMKVRADNATLKGSIPLDNMADLLLLLRHIRAKFPETG
jgi:DNA invertase Pin-like site-specific DNA recombinase